MHKSSSLYVYAATKDGLIENGKPVGPMLIIPSLKHANKLENVGKIEMKTFCMADQGKYFKKKNERKFIIEEKYIDEYEEITYLSV